MLYRTTPEVRAQQFQRVLEANLLAAEDTAVIVLDRAVLDNRLQYLVQSFPQGTLHAAAIKTNPLSAVIRRNAEMGYGAEAASLEEVHLALAAGMPPDRIVFDSPVKTREEMAWCEAHCTDMILNANALEELERLQTSRNLRIGLRINPLLEETGAPDIFNVSKAESKFGVPLSEKAAILNACRKRPIHGLHLHIGSEVADYQTSVQAIRKVIDLGKEIVRVGGANSNQLDFIDIGGGFPARYPAGPTWSMDNWLKALRETCPELWEQEWQVVTEFGRFLYAHCAFLVSRVEYVLKRGRVRVAMIHAGADMFVREVYQEGAPEHQLFVLNRDGQLKERGASMAGYNIAGPLCFAGDYLGKGVELPRIEEGDYLMVSDVGGNTFALWSRHCSRAFPKVVEVDRDNVQVIKPRESIAQIQSFWG